MSSDASFQGAAAALDALAWLDEDVAAALVTLFGDGDGESPAALRCAPAAVSPPAASCHDSEGGSSGRASACNAAGGAKSLGTRTRAPAASRSGRFDGLRFLDVDCARGCDK